MLGDYSHVIATNLRYIAYFIVLETQKFYEILSKTGTDFTMMALWFPKRTRMEIKVTYTQCLV